MIQKILQKNRGFALLFAVTLTAILLSVALGITGIAMKEIQFGTSAKNTNDAFFAADSGAEYVLYNDRSDVNGYPAPSPTGTRSWNDIVTDLGSSANGCAIITITKTVTFDNATTIIVSKGHNNGSPACGNGSNTVERQLEINY